MLQKNQVSKLALVEICEVNLYTYYRKHLLQFSTAGTMGFLHPQKIEMKNLQGHSSIMQTPAHIVGIPTL